ncbi:MAG: LysR family transcriptional regulator [Pseudomonadota bacterium]|nr:LysR family transcriptional regulator [Pseudomonadota bacterium]
MPQTSPLNIDFAALRVLRVVHEQRSFSRAAEHLGTNQSTISYTIERLRAVFQDPLFIRQAGGVAPTVRCDKIVEDTQPLIETFLELANPDAFDPASAKATVRLACNYFERATIVPHLVRDLRRAAPDISLRIVSSTSQGRELLSSGEADTLVGPFKIEATGFYRERLFREEYVCVMDPHNPLAKDDLSIEQFLDAPHAVVTYGRTWKSWFLQEMDHAGLKLRMALELPSPAILPELIEGTDLISTIPSRIAKRFGPQIVTRPCPFPARFDTYLNGTARPHRSPLHQWLRQGFAATKGL